MIIYGNENIVNSAAAKLYQKITKLFLGSPNLIISPSRWLLDEHLKRGFFKNSKTEIKKLENILKISLADSAINDAAKPFKKLLFVGQLEKHKGILFLLDAFKKLAPADMTLAIGGDGSLLKIAQNLAQDDKRIHFLGRLSSEDLEKTFLEADVLIMPSLCYENYPLIIIEARQAGLPVIAANIGGIPEALGNGGRLFNPGDAADLFKKINKT